MKKFLSTLAMAATLSTGAAFAGDYPDQAITLVVPYGPGGASDLAGRALSAYNLVIFAGIFVVQWGIGLLVDAGRALGLANTQAYQLALACFGVSSVCSWAFFMLKKPVQAR